MAIRCLGKKILSLKLDLLIDTYFNQYTIKRQLTGQWHPVGIVTNQIIDHVYFRSFMIK